MIAPALISPDSPGFTQVFDSPNSSALNGRTLTPSGMVSDGNSGNNYSYTFTTANGTINPKPIIATLTAANKTYDGTNTEPDVSMSCSVAPVVSGETVNCAPTSGTFDAPNAGTHTVMAMVTISGAAASNYTLGSSGTALSSVSATASANITTKPITATLTAADKIYDGSAMEPNASMSCSLTGVVATDSGNVSCTPSSGTFNTSQVATANQVTAMVTISGTAAGNYTLGAAGTTTASTTAMATAHITPATPTVTVTDPMPTYDGNPHNATAAAKGVNNAPVTGSFSFTYDGSATAPINAKTSYVVVATFTSTDPNYTNANGNGTLTIIKADSSTVVSVAGGESFTYDGLAHPATVTVTGVGGLNLAPVPVYSCGHAPVNVPDSGCTASYHYSGDANHNSSNGSITYTIHQTTSTTTMSTGFSIVYDGLSHGVNANVTGVGGLNQSVPVTYTPGGSAAPVNPGTYTATATFAGDANHLGSSAGPVTINITFGVCSAGVGAGSVVLPPINNDGTSVYQRKGGSTIPVKFRVCGASGAAISSPALVFAPTPNASLTMLSAVRGTIDNINEVGGVDVPDSAFRWDASGQQWIFNMATTNLTSGNTYLFRINLAYGPASIYFVVGVK